MLPVMARAQFSEGAGGFGFLPEMGDSIGFRGPQPDGKGRPPRRPGKGHHPPMSGFGGRNTKQNGTVSPTGLALSEGEISEANKTYTSTIQDENVIQAKGGTINLTDCIIKKLSGDATDQDGSSFYGINSAVYAGKGATVNIMGGTITTDALGANAIVAIGGTVNATGVKIVNSKNLSRGIHATVGGTIIAQDLNITTAGDNSSVIATDRGGGKVYVTGGSYQCTGKDCAVTYSTGDIQVTDATGSSAQGEVGVIEGDNSITLNNCTMTSGSKLRGLMILQSGSGDSEGYNGKIAINGGTITLTESDTPLLAIPTNITGTLTLTDANLVVPSNILMDVSANSRWETSGATGNLLLKTTSGFTYNGDVKADSEGTANVTVAEGVIWNGAFNNANTAKQAHIVVSGTWNLTADSYVNSVETTGNGKINTNGFKLHTAE